MLAAISNLQYMDIIQGGETEKFSIKLVSIYIKNTDGGFTKQRNSQ
jgi:hypothetical protein